MSKVQEKLARKAAAKEDLGLEEPEVATESESPPDPAEDGPKGPAEESTVGAQQVKPSKSLSDDPPPLAANQERTDAAQDDADKGAVDYRAAREKEDKEAEARAAEEETITADDVAVVTPEELGIRGN